MKIFFVITACFLCLTSCTYNISMAHTEGFATDTIDDTASNTPDVSPEISIPATAL